MSFDSCLENQCEGMWTPLKHHPCDVGSLGQTKGQWQPGPSQHSKRDVPCCQQEAHTLTHTRSVSFSPW